MAPLIAGPAGRASEGPETTELFIDVVFITLSETVWWLCWKLYLFKSFFRFEIWVS